MVSPTLGEAHIECYIVCLGVDHDCFGLNEAHDVVYI